MTDTNDVTEAGKIRIGQRIQQEEHEKAVRVNAERTAKLEAATRLSNFYAATGDPAARREAEKLFQEAGMPVGGTFPAGLGDFRKPGEAGYIPHAPPPADPYPFGRNGLPNPAMPPPGTPPTHPAPPEALDIPTLVAALAPIVTALFNRKEGSSERREAFKSYAYVAMASGKSAVEAYELATWLLECEDEASGAEEKEPEPEQAPGLGSVGLGGEAG